MNAASKRRSSVGFFPDRQAQSCAATLQFCVPDLTCHAALVSRELSPIWVWKPTEVYATMWRHLVANQGLNARSMERCGTLWSPEKPYRGGGPAVTDLLGGQVQVYFATTASSIEHVKSGKLRALAVTTATRVPALPDIPALAEFLPSYDASIYVGIVAPRTTPAEIISKLNQEINLGLTDSKITRRIAELGDAPLSLSSSEFAKLVAEETGMWGKVIREANVKAQ